MNDIDWENIEALETIANQCIYKGKEVGQARAALKAIYGYNVTYEDELNKYMQSFRYNQGFVKKLLKTNFV